MAKDVGELLLDGLVYATARAEDNGQEDLANFLGELYQVAGEVIFSGHEAKVSSPCALSIFQKMDKDGYFKE